MSLETIQNEIAAWPEAQLRQLQGFLVGLSHQREGKLARFAEKLDDASGERWISLADAESQLGLGAVADEDE